MDTKFQGYIKEVLTGTLPTSKLIRFYLYLYTSIMMACILLQQCSQYIVLYPAVAQFVTRLCIDI